MDERELLARLAGLAVLKKRLDGLIEETKVLYGARHSVGSKDKCAFDGVDVATVSYTKPGQGAWRVEDREAYGAWLMEHELGDGTSKAWRMAALPTDDATDGAFLAELVEGFGQVDGVHWKPGAPAVVKVTVGRGMEDRAFDPRALAEAALPLIGRGPRPA